MYYYVGSACVCVCVCVRVCTLAHLFGRGKRVSCLCCPVYTTQVWGPFDAVVIATPLEAAKLGFVGMDLPHIPHRKYQRTVSTVIRGKLDPAYFGVTAMPGGNAPLSLS
jgi:hypothetical protein